MKTNVINHVKTFRFQLNMTQEELAKQVSVSRQSINSIEQGLYIRSLPLALKMGRLFACSTDELFQLQED